MWVKKVLKKIIGSNALVREICYIAYSPVLTLKEKIQKKQFDRFSTNELMEFDAKMYRERQGRTLDWNNIKSYTEKMQLEKLFNNYQLKSDLTDKFKVRKWVAEKIGEEYLIPLVGAWSKYSEINFDKLPERFVMKTNHGSSDVVVVKEKSKMSLADRLRMKRIISNSMRKDYALYACELHYSKIEPLIIVEEFIDSGESDLRDYKFLCFDGVPYYCWVDIGRYTEHKRNVYDMQWNLQSWNQFSYGNTEENIEKPDNFEEMIDIVKRLSNGFAHVRVDLYNVSGKIYFGEMTFTNGSGFEEIVPLEMDYKLGDLWNLNINNKES